MDKDEAIKKFDPTEAELTAMVEESRKIAAVDFEDPIQMKAVKEHRVALKNARVRIEKAGKSIREDALEFQRGVIAHEKGLIAIISPEEDRLEALEEQAKAAVLRKARIEGLPARKQRLQAISTKVEIASDDYLLGLDGSEFEGYVNVFKSKALDLERQELDEQRKKEEARQREEQKKRDDEMAAERKKLEAEKMELKRKQDLVDATEKQRLQDLETRKEAVAAASEVKPEQKEKPVEDYQVGTELQKAKLKRLGEILKKEVPAGMGFTVLMFDYGDGGSMFYLSSALREDMLKAMREFIAKNS